MLYCRNNSPLLLAHPHTHWQTCNTQGATHVLCRQSPVLIECQPGHSRQLTCDALLAVLRGDEVLLGCVLPIVDHHSLHLGQPNQQNG